MPFASVMIDYMLADDLLYQFYAQNVSEVVSPPKFLVFKLFFFLLIYVLFH